MNTRRQCELTRCEIHLTPHKLADAVAMLGAKK